MEDSIKRGTRYINKIQTDKEIFFEICMEFCCGLDNLEKINLLKKFFDRDDCSLKSLSMQFVFDNIGRQVCLCDCIIKKAELLNCGICLNSLLPKSEKKDGYSKFKFFLTNGEVAKIKMLLKDEDLGLIKARMITMGTH